MGIKIQQDPKEFLSPPSARRATLQSRADEEGADISIPTLREEGDDKIYHAMGLDKEISIPTLREEGDPYKIGRASCRERV